MTDETEVKGEVEGEVKDEVKDEEKTIDGTIGGMGKIGGEAKAPEENKAPPFKLEKVWAFTVKDPRKEGEGIVSMSTQHGVVPMVAFDTAQLALYSKMAQNVSNQTGAEVTVWEFAGRTKHITFEKKAVIATGPQGIVGPDGKVINS